MIEVSDQIEQPNARRIQYLIELASLRGTSLNAVMQELVVCQPSFDRFVVSALAKTALTTNRIGTHRITLDTLLVQADRNKPTCKNSPPASPACPALPALVTGGKLLPS